MKSNYNLQHCTKMKFFIKDFFSKCDQIRIYCGFGHLKSLMENFIFCVVQMNHSHVFGLDMQSGFYNIGWLNLF